MRSKPIHPFRIYTQQQKSTHEEFMESSSRPLDIQPCKAGAGKLRLGHFSNGPQGAQACGFHDTASHYRMINDLRTLVLVRYQTSYSEK